MKIIITFGSKHLEWLHHRLNPMNIALVVEADNETIARGKVFNSRIGEFFSTSCLYDEQIDKFTEMGLKEYTLSELDDLIWKPSSYGVLMARTEEYLIYHNQYDDNYSINRTSDYSNVLLKITKNEMLDFINNPKKNKDRK